MSKRPQIAFLFRYGPADHAELFHAMPAIFEALAPECDLHYYGMKTDTPLPENIAARVTTHFLPFHIKRTSNRDKLFKTILWILSMPFIALHCRRHGVDVVYLDETIPCTAGICRIFFGRKTAITVADMFTDIYFTGRLAPIGRMIKYLDIQSWKTLPLIFTRAKTTRLWLEEQGVEAKRIHPVYDPCDFSIYHPLSETERQSIRQSVGFTSDDIVLVHHGILHPNKGNDWIIRILADLLPTHPQLKYFLIGDGPEMNNLCRLVKELNIEQACRFTGWLPTLQEVNQALNAGDIGLVMRTGAKSDDFHMTGALVHSMACGLPLLAARLGGVMEVVEEERNGLLFSPSDAEECKLKWAMLAVDPALRRRLGSAAAQDAHVYFDLQKTVQDTITPLLSLARREPGVLPE